MSTLEATLIHNDGDWTFKVQGDMHVNWSHGVWISEILGKAQALDIHALIVDVTDVDHIDSRGIKFLFDLHTGLAREDIAVVLRNPSPHLRRLLQIMQFDKLFQIDNSQNQ